MKETVGGRSGKVQQVENPGTGADELGEKLYVQFENELHIRAAAGLSQSVHRNILYLGMGKVGNAASFWMISSAY